MKVKCMFCSRSMEYVRIFSNVKNGLRTYVCWSCDLMYKMELKEHLTVGIICKATLEVL